MIEHNVQSGAPPRAQRWLCIAAWTLLAAPVLSLAIAFVAGFVVGLVAPGSAASFLIPTALTLPFVVMLLTILLGIRHKLPGT